MMQYLLRNATQCYVTKEQVTSQYNHNNIFVTTTHHEDPRISQKKNQI